MGGRLVLFSLVMLRVVRWFTIVPRATWRFGLPLALQIERLSWRDFKTSLAKHLAQASAERERVDRLRHPERYRS